MAKPLAALVLFVVLAGCGLEGPIPSRKERPADNASNAAALP